MGEPISHHLKIFIVFTSVHKYRRTHNAVGLNNTLNLSCYFGGASDCAQFVNRYTKLESPQLLVYQNKVSSSKFCSYLLVRIATSDGSTEILALLYNILLKRVVSKLPGPAKYIELLLRVE